MSGAGFTDDILQVEGHKKHPIIPHFLTKQC